MYNTLRADIRQADERLQPPQNLAHHRRLSVWVPFTKHWPFVRSALTFIRGRPSGMERLPGSPSSLTRCV